MNKRECCRAVFSALENAHNESGSALQISEIMKKRLECACSIISKMTENDEAELSQAIVSQSGLSVVMECDDELLLERENGQIHPFFNLIKKFDKFSFSKARNDRLRITLTIGKPWVN